MKSREYALIYLSMQLLNVCFVSDVVLIECHRVYFVSLYKGKGYNYECSNSGVICLLCVVGKLCRRVLTNRIRDSTDCAISDEQSAFRSV